MADLRVEDAALAHIVGVLERLRTRIDLAARIASQQGDRLSHEAADPRLGEAFEVMSGVARSGGYRLDRALDALAQLADATRRQTTAVDALAAGKVTAVRSAIPFQVESS